MVTYHYRTRRVIFGLFYLLVGLAFVLDSSGAVRVSPNDIWPLLLIALGAGTLLNRARRLQVEEDRSAQLAVAEERVRIARELHDIVAHGVSLMTIQIAAARRVAATKPDASEQSLVAAEQTGRQTLSELDSLLAVLRGADASIGAASSVGAPGTPVTDAAPVDPSDPRMPLPRLADIPALVNSLRDAGRDVRFSVLGDSPPVPTSVELVLYRVVQEALTNAVRYAGESVVDIQLINTPETITLFVDDEGPGPGAAVEGRPGGGHGLVGMGERLAAVGGSLSAGPRHPGPGWRVQASIPVLAMVP
ncbi:MAG TPA: histidine kinase [Acidimicrobiales bacterium]